MIFCVLLFFFKFHSILAPMGDNLYINRYILFFLLLIEIHHVCVFCLAVVILVVDFILHFRLIVARASALIIT